MRELATDANLRPGGGGRWLGRGRWQRPWRRSSGLGSHWSSGTALGDLFVHGMCPEQDPHQAGEGRLGDAPRRHVRPDAGPAPAVDMARVSAHIQDVIARIYEHDSPEALERTGVDVILGPARFTGPHTLVAGGQELHGRRFLICTGSHPTPGHPRASRCRGPHLRGSLFADDVTTQAARHRGRAGRHGDEPGVRSPRVVGNGVPARAASADRRRCRLLRHDGRRLPGRRASRCSWAPRSSGCPRRAMRWS